MSIEQTIIKSENMPGLFERVSVKRWYFAVLGAAILLYAVSCAPGSLWQDSGMIQYRVLHNDIEGGLGLALSHPLFYVLAIGAKYVPVGEFTHRVNLVSAIAAAVSVANVFLLLRLWLGKNLPGVIGAVTFALSHTFWQHASIAETYTLYTAIFTAELIMLLQYVKSRQVKYLYWLGMFNGLAISDHMLASIPLLCYAIFFVTLLAKKDIHPKHLAVIIGLWVIGALPYEYLIVKNLIQTGDLWGTLASAAFGSSWKGAVLNTGLSFRIVKENVMWILLNFPTLNILLLFFGLAGLYKIQPVRGFSNVLLALLVLFFVFAFRYTIVDRYAFFIPFYCLTSILIGVGAYVFLSGKKKVLVWIVLLLALLPVPAYAFVPVAAKYMGLKNGRGREIPYRDDCVYFLRPWQTAYLGADRFANEALDAVEDNAIIYADGTTVYALLLAQEVGDKHRDVTVVSGHGTVNNLKEYNEDVIDELFRQRSIYVVSAVKGYFPLFLSERYEFEKKGVLYKAAEKNK